MTHQQLLGAAPGNTEQVRAWNGDEGQYWAEHADLFDASLRAYQAVFLAAAELRSTDRVLDVGCGTGQTSIDAGRLTTEGNVLGVDLSAAMLDVARQRATRAGLTNVAFLQSDAQVHAFEGASFDVVMGRTSAMFFGDPAAAFANLAAALRPGGRLVLLVWQGLEHNEWLRSILGAMAAGRDLPAPPPDRPGPFALSEPDRVRRLLTAGGFATPDLTDLKKPMCLERTAEEATEFMSGLNAWMLQGLDAEGRRRALETLAQSMHDHEGPSGVEFGSATWLIRSTRAT